MHEDSGWTVATYYIPWYQHRSGHKSLWCGPKCSWSAILHRFPQLTHRTRNIRNISVQFLWRKYIIHREAFGALALLLCPDVSVITRFWKEMSVDLFSSTTSSAAFSNEISSLLFFPSWRRVCLWIFVLSARGQTHCINNISCHAICIQTASAKNSISCSICRGIR